MIGVLNQLTPIILIQVRALLCIIIGFIVIYQNKVMGGSLWSYGG